MAGYLPPDWPVGGHPPGSEQFEQTAVAWLLDVVPPDYRVHGVLLRHPAALAALARHHLAACVQGARQGYRSARSELGGQIPPRGVKAVLAAYCDEGGRLVKTAHAVDLVAHALRGEIFAPQPPEPASDSEAEVSASESAVSARVGTAPVSQGRGSSRPQGRPAAQAGPSGTTPPSQPARKSRPRQTRARTGAEARAR
jgi:hypothetical protein